MAKGGRIKNNLVEERALPAPKCERKTTKKFNIP